jgi:predicted amidohydrolase
MFATGFTMATGLAEEYGQETEQFLGQLAAEFQVAVVAGVAIRSRDEKVRNKALLFAPDGRLMGFYAKMQPFTLGGEADHYTAGLKPVVVEWQGWKIAPYVCYDLRFPELFRLAAATSQPDLFVVIANWPDKRIHHWLRLLAARAIENQAYVVGVNRCGQDPFHSYTGRTVILDPHGEIVADAGNAECCIHAELNLAALSEYRSGLPFLADLRSAHFHRGE